jgi:hypothetical protein
MGDIYHHAIIVIGTEWRSHQLVAAREYAIEAGNSVTEIVPSRTNGFSSFMVAPDGSKEGWANSNEGDEVYFGWEGGTRITRSSNPPEDWRRCSGESTSWARRGTTGLTVRRASARSSCG